jgi:hypothetical protein
MKLYTEEQVKTMLIKTDKFTPLHIEHLMNEITHIEIPSDEEIYQAEPKECSGDFDLGVMNGFRKGAKWMRDKIQGGKDE